MTVAVHKRNLFDALLGEPIRLVIDQPHQALISTASVYLVAAEAGMLIDSPANWLMAIGAEWAYLRGLSSGQQVQTPWAARLNWAAVLLVVAYGSLWSLRKFGVIPNDPSTGVAVILTAIHILTIGAVTLCSAMVHREMLRDEADSRNAQEHAQREREQRLQAERDRLTLKAEEERQALALEHEKRLQDMAHWEEAQNVKARLKMQGQNAPQRNARNALSEGINAKPKTCPKCHRIIDNAAELGAARRWGHCKACKEVQP